MQVTDMILEVDQLVAPDGLPAVELQLQAPELREETRRFVADEYPSFLQYYESPKPGTDVYAVTRAGQMVGMVLLEKTPGAAELPTDGAMACLVIADKVRGQKLGSAAIVACCLKMRELGFSRVIAEWVASIELYSRLGFRIWRTRDITPEAGH